MTKYLISLPLLFLTACATDLDTTQVITRPGTYCEESTVEKRASFILQCIENANPKSDEEPEDWITDCRYMAEATYCKKVSFEITERCIGDKFGCYWREESRKPIL